LYKKFIDVFLQTLQRISHPVTIKFPLYYDPSFSHAGVLGFFAFFAKFSGVSNRRDMANWDHYIIYKEGNKSGSRCALHFNGIISIHQRRLLLYPLARFTLSLDLPS